MRENGREITLGGLYIYPIKSLKGIALDEAKVERRGLEYDRRWMLVDEENTFITQREHPRMATIKLGLEAEGLRASAEGMEDLLIAYHTESSARVRVRVWRSNCEAAFVSERADEWFSRFLQTSCRLVYMPDDVRREVNPEYSVNQDIVSFADGYPFKLIGEASLDELNARLERRVPVNRFRPNFVLQGTPPFDEDEWDKILIGGTLFHAVKPCERCQITTIEQDQGIRTGPEPLKTLATYRTMEGKVLFGQYLIADVEGSSLRVGDTVKIIARKGRAGNGHSR